MAGREFVLETYAENSKKSGLLGIWIFVISEGLFFSALFLGFVVYAGSYRAAFERGAEQLNLQIGTANTAILLTSSFTMALAAKYARNPRRLAICAALTVALAATFLGLKAVEYHEEFSKHLLPGPDFLPGQEKPFQLFFVFYFLMTAFHALHIVGGMIAISWTTVRAYRDPKSSLGVELSALYWHFVDLIWVFLFPLLYLTGRGK